MSCANRNFANVARKLLPLAILGQQKVHPEDSLFSLSPGLVADPRGLSTDYRAPIQKAFYPNYWQNNDSQIEKNLAPLEHVVVFYDRGGDRQVFKNGTDSTGTGDLPIHSASGKPDKSNLDPDIGTLSSPNGGLGLTKVERAALVAFVRSLTDDRVACHSGPFDRPELPISLGHPSNKAIPAILTVLEIPLPISASKSKANPDDARHRARQISGADRRPTHAYRLPVVLAGRPDRYSPRW